MSIKSFCQWEALLVGNSSILSFTNSMVFADSDGFQRWGSDAYLFPGLREAAGGYLRSTT